MAKQVLFVHKETEKKRIGYVGFSWTTLFFGPFPSLFRKYYAGVVCWIILLVPVKAIFNWSGYADLDAILGITNLIWAFEFNKLHAKDLLDRGYEIKSSELPLEIATARIKGDGD